MMVTEGGKGNKTEWKQIRHFSDEALRKRGQKILLDEVTTIYRNSNSIRSLKNKLRKHVVGGYKGCQNQ